MIKSDKIYRLGNEPGSAEDLNDTNSFLTGDTGGGGGGIFGGDPPPAVPDPAPTPTPINETPDIILTPATVNETLNYEIAFTSNLLNELGDVLQLKYDIRSGDTIHDSDELFLADGNTDGKSILNSLLPNSVVNLYLDDTLLSQNYNILNIYYADRQTATNNPTNYAKWKIGNKFIGAQASELKSGGIAVAVILEKVIAGDKPMITLETTQYTKQIKDSDLDSIVNIKFTQKDSEFIDFYISTDRKIRVDASVGFVSLSFKNDFGGVYGNKKIIVVPSSEFYGTGDSTDILINFISINDFPSITQIIAPDFIDVPSFSDLQLEYEVEWNSFSASSIDVELLQKNNTKIILFKNLTPNGKLKINLRELRNKFKGWEGSNNVTLFFKPYNRAGQTELIGNEYEIKTSLSIPAISLDENILKTTLFDAFLQNIKFSEPEKESKYLTHLANFGNDEQLLVSSWEEDNFTLSDKKVDELGNTIITKEVQSLILKLYSPLPANITENSTLWITKLLTNPLIETVVLNNQDDLKCPPIKGPNFNIDVDFVKGKSTSYESLDDLIYSGSTQSSTGLISQYLSASLTDTDDLNIQYTNNSEYIWNNFIHFSSAKERVDNFVYKVQLIEVYEDAVLNAQTASWNNTLQSKQEIERQTIKKEQIIQGFDGFEKFLYTPSSMSWPYSGSDRVISNSSLITNTNGTGWYDTIIELAEIYDINNSNWIQNNIPQYIVNNDENQSFLLFFSMIGQHFDNIYFYTKSIEKSRNLGYKAKDGISDKLLFDVLKSFNWDAKNLSADSQLWNYAFGLDSDGNTKNLTPAKKRTYEVWRRIANNIPYLLKHKGTRRGVYALLSCYGIPSSNLSILEFGGPEVTTTNKSKFEFDNVTTALKMNLGSSFEIDWKQTNNSPDSKPNTIEFFIKPQTNSNYTLISGSGWGVSLSGSTNQNFGQVVFNYSGSTSISTTQLPIFNGNFFGVSVSSGSNGLKLDVRQSEKERTIFQQSITSSAFTLWNSGTSIRFGENYSGSVDEFRLWSSQLDTNRFYEHVSFPEMINGNDIFGSTDELHFRLDFEYPKNLAATSSLINVDTNIWYPKIQLNESTSFQLNRNILEETGSVNLDSIQSVNSFAIYTASAGGFIPVSEYPFQFEAIDRSVVLEVPDAGSTRYSTNKVRFESQELISDLSSKSRSTKKAFDQSPTDSNRVGLFFSPTKELNIDIAKSFGGINLDNYIGDPSDKYKSNYKRLDELRNYYFQRFDGRDIYAYINLIKLYEKSMFEDIKKMLPARVKATTGLLIEPHILERSKIAQKKPTGVDYQQDVVIHYVDTTILTSENIQKEVTIDSNLSENLIGENNQLDTTITDTTIENIVAENYQLSGLYEYLDESQLIAENYQQNVAINVGLEEPTITTELELGLQIVGQTEYETIGFGIYAQSGSAIRTYFDKDNRRVKERIRLQLITEEKERIITKFAVTSSATGLGDIRGGYISDIETYTETKLNIQPFLKPNGQPTNIPIVTGNIISVVPVSGYLKTHYRNTSDLTRGLENSFFKGSKNTAATTLDGSSPVEIFISNPNTLTVNRTGRNNSEPILEVE